jgi:hypothetical protein
VAEDRVFSGVRTQDVEPERIVEDARILVRGADAPLNGPAGMNVPLSL